MKYLRLLILLLRKGSLSQKPHDFEADRQQEVNNFFMPASTRPDTKPGWKRYLLRTSWGYGILSNLAYLKNAREMNRMYYVSDAHKLVYIRILKSASTSVLKEFLPLVDPKLSDASFTDAQVDALGYYHAKKELTAQQEGYSKFAVVRDPFRRIVSVYLDLFNPTAPTFTYATYWFGILRREMTFKDFVRAVSAIPSSFSGPHLATQVSILKDASELKNISILKVEEPELLEKYLEQQGMSMPHANKQSSDYDYRSYYDPETLALVYNIYRDDIDLLAYREKYETLRYFILQAFQKRTL